MEMASDNQIIITGNLTDDPELRYTPNGAAVVKFRVAVNKRYKDEAGNWKDGETSYFTVNAWRTLAENVAESLTRGTRVVVAGRLQMRSWETQEGDKRTVVEIEADEIGPSLRWATAKVERQGRSVAATGPRRSASELPTRTRRHRWMPQAKARGRRPKKDKDDKGWQKKQKRKICIFCKDHIEYVDYKDTMVLRKFVSDRGKIRARRVTGNCSQHQRDVATAVKNAREMALLPYSTR